MSLLTDSDIRRYCESPVYCAEWGPMIDPFCEAVSGNGVIGYGLSSCGYDIRLGNEVWYLKSSGETINPKKFKDPEYRDRVMDRRYFEDGAEVTIPANGYILGVSKEYFRIPRTVAGRCEGKSTYARCAVQINITKLEPEWEGYLTIEIANGGPSPIIVFAGEGICQISFETLSGRPEKTYKDKGGKYQKQVGVTPAIVL